MDGDDVPSATQAINGDDQLSGKESGSAKRVEAGSETEQVNGTRDGHVSESNPSADLVESAQGCRVPVAPSGEANVSSSSPDNVSSPVTTAAPTNASLSPGLHPAQMQTPVIRPIIPKATTQLLPVKSEPVDSFPSTSHIEGVIELLSSDDESGEFEVAKAPADCGSVSQARQSVQDNGVGISKADQSDSHRTRVESADSLEDYDDSIPAEERMNNVKLVCVTQPQPMFGSGAAKSNSGLPKSAPVEAESVSSLTTPTISKCHGSPRSGETVPVTQMEFDTDDGLVQVQVNKSIGDILSRLDEESCHSNDEPVKVEKGEKSEGRKVEKNDKSEEKKFVTKEQCEEKKEQCKEKTGGKREKTVETKSEKKEDGHGADGPDSDAIEIAESDPDSDLEVVSVTKGTKKVCTCGRHVGYPGGPTEGSEVAPLVIPGDDNGVNGCASKNVTEKLLPEGSIRIPNSLLKDLPREPEAVKPMEIIAANSSVPRPQAEKSGDGLNLSCDNAEETNPLLDDDNDGFVGAPSDDEDNEDTEYSVPQGPDIVEVIEPPKPLKESEEKPVVDSTVPVQTAEKPTPEKGQVTQDTEETVKTKAGTSSSITPEKETPKPIGSPQSTVISIGEKVKRITRQGMKSRDETPPPANGEGISGASQEKNGSTPPTIGDKVTGNPEEHGPKETPCDEEQEEEVDVVGGQGNMGINTYAPNVNSQNVPITEENIVISSKQSNLGGGSDQQKEGSRKEKAMAFTSQMDHLELQIQNLAMQTKDLVSQVGRVSPVESGLGNLSDKVKGFKPKIKQKAIDDLKNYPCHRGRKKQNFYSEKFNLYECKCKKGPSPHFHCNICDMISKAASTVLRHETTTHGQPREGLVTICCPVTKCKMLFLQRSELVRHITRHRCDETIPESERTEVETQMQIAGSLGLKVSRKVFSPRGSKGNQSICSPRNQGEKNEEDNTVGEEKPKSSKSKHIVSRRLTNLSKTQKLVRHSGWILKNKLTSQKNARLLLGYSGGFYRCSQCTFKSSHWYTMKKHRTQVHGMFIFTDVSHQFQCKLCGYFTKLKMHMARHILSSRHEKHAHAIDPTASYPKSKVSTKQMSEKSSGINFDMLIQQEMGRGIGVTVTNLDGEELTVDSKSQFDHSSNIADEEDAIYSSDSESPPGSFQEQSQASSSLDGDSPRGNSVAQPQTERKRYCPLYGDFKYEFSCKLCEFRTKRAFNMGKHILSIKHRKNVHELDPTVEYPACKAVHRFSRNGINLDELIELEVGRGIGVTAVDLQTGKHGKGSQVQHEWISEEASTKVDSESECHFADFKHKFSCNLCGFCSSRRINVSRHILTHKHRNKVLEIDPTATYPDCEIPLGNVSDGNAGINLNTLIQKELNRGIGFTVVNLGCEEQVTSSELQDEQKSKSASTKVASESLIEETMEVAHSTKEVQYYADFKHIFICRLCGSSIRRKLSACRHILSRKHQEKVHAIHPRAAYPKCTIPLMNISEHNSGINLNLLIKNETERGIGFTVVDVWDEKQGAVSVPETSDSTGMDPQLGGSDIRMEQPKMHPQLGGSDIRMEQPKMDPQLGGSDIRLKQPKMDPQLGGSDIRMEQPKMEDGTTLTREMPNDCDVMRMSYTFSPAPHSLQRASTSGTTPATSSNLAEQSRDITSSCSGDKWQTVPATSPVGGYSSPTIGYSSDDDVGCDDFIPCDSSQQGVIVETFSIDPSMWTQDSPRPASCDESSGSSQVATPKRRGRPPKTSPKGKSQAKIQGPSKEDVSEDNDESKAGWNKEYANRILECESRSATNRQRHRDDVTKRRSKWKGKKGKKVEVNSDPESVATSSSRASSEEPVSLGKSTRAKLGPKSMQPQPKSSKPYSKGISQLHRPEKCQSIGEMLAEVTVGSRSGKRRKCPSPDVKMSERTSRALRNVPSRLSANAMPEDNRTGKVVKNRASIDSQSSVEEESRPGPYSSRNKRKYSGHVSPEPVPSKARKLNPSDSAKSGHTGAAAPPITVTGLSKVPGRDLDMGSGEARVLVSKTPVLKTKNSARKSCGPSHSRRSFPSSVPNKDQAVSDPTYSEHRRHSNHGISHSHSNPHSRQVENPAGIGANIVLGRSPHGPHASTGESSPDRTRPVAPRQDAGQPHGSGQSGAPGAGADSTVSSTGDPMALLLTQAGLPSMVPQARILDVLSNDDLLEELTRRKALQSCVCGLAFTNSTYYYLHRSSHDTIDPQKCGFCGTRLGNPYEFVSHFFQQHHR